MLCRSKKRPEEKTPELPVSSLDGPERETTPEPSSSGRINTFNWFTAPQKVHFSGSQTPRSRERHRVDEHEETDDDFLWGELLFPDADGGGHNHSSQSE